MRYTWPRLVHQALWRCREVDRWYVPHASQTHTTFIPLTERPDELWATLGDPSGPPIYALAPLARCSAKYASNVCEDDGSCDCNVSNLRHTYEQLANLHSLGTSNKQDNSPTAFSRAPLCLMAKPCRTTDAIKAIAASTGRVTGLVTLIAQIRTHFSLSGSKVSRRGAHRNSAWLGRTSRG
jgi:hypothetical protein